MDAIIEFTPQAWIRDYAFSVDPEGDTIFTIPADDPDLYNPDGSLIDDDSYDSDVLKDHENAPAWIRNWSGPFEVAIVNRDAITALRDATSV